MTFTAGVPPTFSDMTVKVGYRAAAVPAVVRIVGDGWEVAFAERHPAPAPGQSAVFYDGDRVIGGGIISGVIRS